MIITLFILQLVFAALSGYLYRGLINFTPVLIAAVVCLWSLNGLLAHSFPDLFLTFSIINIPCQIAMMYMSKKLTAPRYL